MPGAWVFLLLYFMFSDCGASVAVDGLSDQQSSLGSPSIWFYVATYGAPLLAYVVLRTLTAHLVLASMMKRAPGPVTADVADNQGYESPSAADLRFVEISSANGILLDASFQERLDRCLTTGRRTWRLFCGSCTVFVAIAAILYVLSRSRSHVLWMTSPGVHGIDTDGSAQTLPSTLYLLLVSIALLICLATVINRYYHIRRVTAVSSLTFLFLLTVLAVGGGRFLSLPAYLYVLPPLASALIMTFGYLKIRREAGRDGNIRLLILRVFGSDRNTSFVFGRLMRSWQYLGTFFTIVDPSYIRYQFSLSSAENRWKLLRFFTLFGLVIFVVSIGQQFFLFSTPTNQALLAWHRLTMEQQQELLGMAAWLILIPLAALPIAVTVRRRFVATVPELNRRIDRAQRQRAGWNGVFIGLPMYCYDNIWKRAVDRLLRASDVLLMDLRGFSPARAGCEYEVGILIDHYPIQQVVFLVDHGETRAAVYELIRRRWRAMSPASPNRSLQAPAIKVYAPAVAEEPRDIPRILALLIASVGGDGESPGTLVGLQGTQKQEEARRARARTKAAGLRFGPVVERLDMALSTPRYARIIVPVMLVGVGGLLLSRMQPLMEAWRTYRSPPTVASTRSEEATVEAAPASATTPAYLKSEFTAHVIRSAGEHNGKSYSNPIVVDADLTGGYAAQAFRYGKINISTSTGDEDDPLDVLAIEDFFPLDSARDRFVVINRSSKDIITGQPKHPPDGIRLTVTLLKPEIGLAQVRRFGGTVALQTINPSKVVTITEISQVLDNPGIVRLTDPRLVQVGMFSLVIEKNDPDRLIIKGEANQEFDFRVVDDQAVEIRPGETSTSSMGTKSEKEYYFARATLSPDARLEIILGYDTVDAPFYGENIRVGK